MITEDHVKELNRLFGKCVDHDDILSTWENTFISEFIEKLDKYGDGIRISEKQQAVIDKIELKLRSAGVEFE